MIQPSESYMQLEDWKHFLLIHVHFSCRQQVSLFGKNGAGLCKARDCSKSQEKKVSS